MNQPQWQQPLNITNMSTNQLITHIQSISIMLGSAVAILSVLICLLTKKKKQKQTNGQNDLNAIKKQNKQLRHGKYLSQQERLANNKNKLKPKSFKFSIDEQYQHYQPQPTYYYEHQQHRQQQHNQLINLLHQQDQIQYPYYQHHVLSLKPQPQFYSLKQQKINFLNNLKFDKTNDIGIYLDDEDIKEREMRKIEIEKRKNLLLQQQQEQKQLLQINKDKVAQGLQQQKEPMKKDNNVLNKKDQKQQPKLTQQQKLQEKKPTPLGEKSLFADNKTQPATLPQQGGLNFGQVTLNLPSQKSLPNKIQQSKSLFGTSTQHNLANNIEAPSTAKKDEKSSLFSGLNIGGGGSLFGQQAGEQKPSLFSTGPVPQQQQQKSLFGQKENIPQKPIDDKKQQTGASKPQTQTAPSQPVLPQPSQQQPLIPPKPSTLPQPSPSSALQKIQKKDYLQMLINYSNSAKQHCELKKTKTNNFGRSISNLKQIYDTSIDFINTINAGDSKQVETLAVMIFDFLINKTIPTWPKQEGWQMFPPRSKNQTQWKISITTYVMKLNLYRAMGHQNLWLIVFGKLLSLLDFTWKRTQQIPKSSTAYKELDFVKNGYFSLQKQDDMAPKYFTRLDLVTYFLFCMTTFDPQLVAEYLCQTAGQDKKTFQQIKKLKYKWTYNYFWILVETILANKTKTYFKPILYMNIMSSMYLQIRKNKLNPNDFKDFDHLRKYITKQAIECTTENELEKNDEVQTLAELDEQNRDFRFDGEDFLGQIETLNFYFKEKDGEYKKASVDRKGFEQFEKRCSVFDFFKSQSKLG